MNSFELLNKRFSLELSTHRLLGLMLGLALTCPSIFAQTQSSEAIITETKKTEEVVVSRWQPNPVELKKAMGEENQIDSFTVQEFAWQDNSRNRKVPAKLYWPKIANPSAKTQLLVFSHGLGGSKDGYSYIGRYLAQNGVASLHLQHVGSDRSVWSVPFYAIPYQLKKAARDEEAIDRAKDFQFGLSQLLNLAPYAQSIDPQQIVAAGHSYGANTTLLVSGAIVERNGLVVSLQDPRVKMAILISAPPFYGSDYASTGKILSAVQIPTLHITATEDVITVPGYYSRASDRIEIFETMQNSAKNLIVFKEGSHNIFTDRLQTGGKELNPKIKKATRELILSFIQNQGDPKLLEKNQQWQNWRLQYSSLVEKTQWAFETPLTVKK